MTELLYWQVGDVRITRVQELEAPDLRFVIREATVDNLAEIEWLPAAVPIHSAWWPSPSPSSCCGVSTLRQLSTALSTPSQSMSLGGGGDPTGQAAHASTLKKSVKTAARTQMKLFKIVLFISGMSCAKRCV